MRHLMAALSLAFATLRNETLLQAIPDGFVIGHSADNGRDAISEFVPRGETVENWHRMLTVQTQRGRGHVTPAQLHAVLGDLWKAACPGSRVTSLTSGEQNGYPVGLWIQWCPFNVATGMPEHTLLKAIQGRDSLYLVQAAMRARPTDEQLAEQARWLSRASVCDTRQPAQACPTETLKPASNAELRALDGRKD